MVDEHEHESDLCTGKGSALSAEPLLPKLRRRYRYSMERSIVRLGYRGRVPAGKPLLPGLASRGHNQLADRFGITVRASIEGSSCLDHRWFV